MVDMVSLVMLALLIGASMLFMVRSVKLESNTAVVISSCIFMLLVAVACSIG